MCFPSTCIDTVEDSRHSFSVRKNCPCDITCFTGKMIKNWEIVKLLKALVERENEQLGN